ncbi:ScbA/BarX family gamma-butyrolactone biosynthesis protein [Kitasatospora atroaurantiaca]
MPRAGVHKSAAGEVLLTDALRLGADRFAIAAIWPRNHLLSHRPEARTSDPLLLVETARQAAIYLSHSFFDVPPGFPFVMQDLDFAIDTPELPGGGRAPLPVMLDATCVRTITGQRCRFALEAVLIVDGRRCGRIGVRWEVLTPTRYDALRRRAAASAGAGGGVPATGMPGEPLAPSRFGHRKERDVLLAADPALPVGSWRLRLDQSHPVIFDHASDHIPGTALLEAFRQAGVLSAPGWTLAGARVAFHSFGELTPAVTVTARSDGRFVEVGAVQGGRTLASAVLLGGNRC